MEGRYLNLHKRKTHQRGGPKQNNPKQSLETSEREAETKQTKAHPLDTRYKYSDFLEN